MRPRMHASTPSRWDSAAPRSWPARTTSGASTAPAPQLECSGCLTDGRARSRLHPCRRPGNRGEPMVRRPPTASRTRFGREAPLATAASGSTLGPMDSRLTWQAAETRVADHHRRAQAVAAARARLGAARREETLDAFPVTVRFATPDDASELRRLAQLDSGRVPAGEALVAEVDGQLLAALPLGGVRALADPFRPTAGLVRLLELRESQLRGRGRRRRRLRASPRFHERAQDAAA
jgi:hypothetical protein